MSRTLVLPLLLLLAGLLLLVQPWRAAQDPEPDLSRPEVRDEPLVELDPVLEGRSALPETPAQPSPEPAVADEAVVEEETVEIVSVPEKDLPPDPLAVGDAVLELHFVDRATGEPWATGFDLWRLDVDGNADWTRGDQRQVESHAPVTKIEMDRLPEGRYRLHVLGAREEAEDPPEFEVRGARTRLTIPLDVPRAVEVRLLVFDERGGRLDEGRVRSGGHGTYGRMPKPPDWVATRRLTGDRMASRSSWMRHGDGFGRGEPEDVLATAEGFHVGTFRAPTRYDHWSRSKEYLFAGGSSVYVRIKNRSLPERTLVGVSLPIAWIRDRVTLEDGTRLVDTGLELLARCEAVELEEGQEASEIVPGLKVDLYAKDGGKFVAKGRIGLTDAVVVLKSIGR